MEDEWDYENGQVQPGRSLAAVVYSVRFPKGELEALRRAAAAAGVSVSEFIRDATREKLHPAGMRTVLFVAGAPGLYQPNGGTSNPWPFVVTGQLKDSYPAPSGGAAVLVSLPETKDEPVSGT